MSFHRFRTFAPNVRRRYRRRARRGWATLWMVIWLPVLLVLFCAMVGVAHLWLARVELENGLEAAALAAVKHWGEAGGGDTLEPREIGVAYADANCIRGNHIQIGTNSDPAAAVCGTINPNQNLSYTLAMTPPTANLIFGMIREEDQDANPATPDDVIFDAMACPSCGHGRVLFDATAEGGGNLLKENAWGISFQKTEDPAPLGFRIDRIEIDLRGSGPPTVGSFLSPLTISDNQDPPDNAVHDNSNQEQPDTVGFKVSEINDPADTQIEWSLTGPGNSVLRFDFRADPTVMGGDLGFEPGDRFRFGIDVDNVSKGSGQDDGDGIGRDGTKVTVWFSINGNPLPPVSGTFVDNTERNNQCLDPALTDPITGTLVVHPTLIPDLPCPETSAANNNGQSYVLLSGNSGGRFGVVAQAFAPVQKFNFPLLGTVNNYCVRARTIAEYDCTTGRARLVRIDEYRPPLP